MKKFNNMKWMLLLMIGLVLLSVTLTAFVVIHMISKEVSKYPSKVNILEKNQEEIVLENVYIMNTEQHKISFIYDNQNYQIEGNLKESYQGVADILIQNRKIKKIFQKESCIEGELLSYDEAQMEISGYGYIDVSEHISYYDISEENQVKEITKDQLYIGETDLKFVIANETICAVMKATSSEVETKEQKIRVLIKNGECLTYDTLFLCADADWTLNGINMPKGEPIEVNDFRNTQMAIASCPNGYLYITDSEKKKMSLGYEGIFFARNTPNGIVLINEIGIEDYVKYVLPSEMEDFFSYEAQKAQAVCARTFAYSQLHNQTYAMYGANVDDSTAFQVYNRFERTLLTDRAVEETMGEIITCNGKAIICYYYSTSPGFSNTLETWEEENPEYISRKSTLMEENKEFEHLKYKKNFKQFLEDKPESYDSKSPYYRWSATLNLNFAEDKEYGKIEQIEIQKRNESGYVIALCVQCKNTELVLRNENEIRSFLGQFLTSLELNDGTYRDQLSMLPSACFIITEQKEGEYKLEGGGFGHGIGLSQYAAGRMSEEGWDYKEIISYFYDNIEICKK